MKIDMGLAILGATFLIGMFTFLFRLLPEKKIRTVCNNNFKQVAVNEHEINELKICQATMIEKMTGIDKRLIEMFRWMKNGRKK